MCRSVGCSMAGASTRSFERGNRSKDGEPRRSCPKPGPIMSEREVVSTKARDIARLRWWLPTYNVAADLALNETCGGRSTCVR